MRYSWKVFGSLLAGVLATAMVAGCGSSGSGSNAGSTSTSSAASSSGSGSEIKIDVGNGRTLTFPAGTKPKIAVFGSSGDAYQEVQRQAAENAARKDGVELTYFDSKAESALELSQVQNALQTKKYNAWVFESYTGPAACNLVTKEAPAANIVVVQSTVPTCAQQEGKPAGEESWAPGTLATIGAGATSTAYDAFVQEAKKLLRPGAKVAVINGIQAVTTTRLLKEAVEKNGIKPIAEVNSNYTTPDALAKTQTMLQAHPEINAIISIYADSTLGAIRAIESAGKTGQIQTFDVGGSKQSVEEIKAGKQTMSVPYFPATVNETAVNVLVEAFAGKPTKRFYPAYAKGTPEHPFVITKSTVASFEPQY